MSKHPRETKDSLKVIGIQMKTINDTASHDITKFWEKFRNEDIFNKIPHKINSTLLALYTDYEGGISQPYHYTICCEVSSLEEIPIGMVGKIIPTADYIILKAQGKFPDCLIQTWQTIWQSDFKRSFRYDFELYKEMDTNHAEIDVYIGVR